MALVDLEKRTMKNFSSIWQQIGIISEYIKVIAEDCVDFEKTHGHIKTSMLWLFALTGEEENVKEIPEFEALIVEKTIARIEEVRCSAIAEEERKKKDAEKREEWGKSIEALETIIIKFDIMAQRIIDKLPKGDCYQINEEVRKIILSPQETGGISLEPQFVDEIAHFVMSRIEKIKKGE